MGWLIDKAMEVQSSQTAGQVAYSSFRDRWEPSWHELDEYAKSRWEGAGATLVELVANIVGFSDVDAIQDSIAVRAKQVQASQWQ